MILRACAGRVAAGREPLGGRAWPAGVLALLVLGVPFAERASADTISFEEAQQLAIGLSQTQAELIADLWADATAAPDGGQSAGGQDPVDGQSLGVSDGSGSWLTIPWVALSALPELPGGLSYALSARELVVIHNATGALVGVVLERTGS